MVMELIRVLIGIHNIMVRHTEVVVGEVNKVKEWITLPMLDTNRAGKVMAKVTRRVMDKPKHREAPKGQDLIQQSNPNVV